MSRVKRIGLALGPVAIFLFCFYYVFKTFNWFSIADLLGAVDYIQFVIGSIALTILYWLLRSWRWQILLGITSSGRVQFWNLYLATACSMALALVTPFQSGEATKVELLKQGSSLTRINGYGSFLAERVIDLFAVLTIGLAYMLVQKTFVISIGPLLVMLAVLLSVVTFIVWFANSKFANKYDGMIGLLFNMLKVYARCPKQFGSATVLSYASWFVVALTWFFCLQSLQLDVNFFETLGLTTIVTIVNIISFVPGALGVSEVSITLGLELLGEKTINAQGGALIIRFYGLIIILLSLLHYLWWIIISRGK